MRSSQVYQPTTTSLPYDNKSWLPSFLTHSERVASRTRIIVFIIALLFAILGLIMIGVGASSLSQDINPESGLPSSFIALLCFGILFEIAAIGAILFYYRYLGYYTCFSGPCCPGKISHIRKLFHSKRTVGAKGEYSGAGEPVSAQYCPPAPASVGSSPPPFADISEQQKLMGEKTDLGDESERILEEDPRIVLTPLKTHEEC